MFPDEIETPAKSIPEFLAPWDMIRSGQSGVYEIESGEQQQRLVRPLVGVSLLHGSDADVEVVEAFDGCIEKHSRRKGIDLPDWKEKERIQDAGTRIRLAFRLKAVSIVGGNGGSLRVGRNQLWPDPDKGGGTCAGAGLS